MRLKKMLKEVDEEVKALLSPEPIKDEYDEIGPIDKVDDSINDE